jgi:hypothetical protein
LLKYCEWEYPFLLPFAIKLWNTYSP